ncbi:hypothetical protein ACVGV2_02490 [Bounagaea algeriensis]
MAPLAAHAGDGGGAPLIARLRCSTLPRRRRVEVENPRPPLRGADTNDAAQHC